MCLCRVETCAPCRRGKRPLPFTTWCHYEGEIFEPSKRASCVRCCSETGVYSLVTRCVQPVCAVDANKQNKTHTHTHTLLDICVLSSQTPTFCVTLRKTGLITTEQCACSYRVIAAVLTVETTLPPPGLIKKKSSTLNNQELQQCDTLLLVMANPR